MTNLNKKRLPIAIGIYVLIVVIAALGFTLMRGNLRGGADSGYAFSIFGPALSLFTHMSYFLFAIQTLILLPSILVGVFIPKSIKLAISAFAITWIGIGWYMHDLF